mgnify:CR=1 FL=1
MPADTKPKLATEQSYKIWYNPGFQSFIVQTPLGNQINFDDDEESDLLAFLRRQAIAAKQANVPAPELDAQTVERLKAKFIDEGGTVKGKITNLDLKDIGL